MVQLLNTANHYCFTFVSHFPTWTYMFLPKPNKTINSLRISGVHGVLSNYYFTHHAISLLAKCQPIRKIHLLLHFRDLPCAILVNLQSIPAYTKVIQVLYINDACWDIPECTIIYPSMPLIGITFTSMMHVGISQNVLLSIPACT